MSVAIVLLNYNDYENTRKYIENVREYKSIEKIVIVDNKSTAKDEVKKLESLTSKKVDLVVSDKNGGYSYGNNVGVKYLEKKYPNKFRQIIISNPDVFVDDTTISYLEDYMNKNKNVAVVAPRMFYKNGPARRSSWKKRTILIDIANSTRLTEFLLYFVFKHGEYCKNDYEKEVLEVDAIAGSFFMIDFNVLKKIGYFDENTFLFYEEDILGEKVRKCGHIIVSLNNLKFIHFESQTIGKAMNMFRKVDILFKSKIYYNKVYNKANFLSIAIFNMLKYVRKFELLFEIPIRKLLRK